MSSEIKKRVLDCYEMSNPLYGSECWGEEKTKQQKCGSTNEYKQYHKHNM